MKVLFDLLPVSFSHHNGVFVYAQRILEGWYMAGIRDVVVLTTPWLAEAVIKPKCPDFKYVEVNVPQVGYTRKCIRVARERLKIINNSGCDIVFYPMPEPFYFQTPKIPQVMVLHDMAKGKYRWYQWYFMLPWQRFNSKRIIAITEYTRKKAQEFYSFLRNRKIDVVYNSLSYDNNIYKPIVEGNYILDINTLHRYKNADTLIRALGLIKDKTDCKLVLVGQDVDGRSADLQQLATDCSIGDRYIRKEGLSNEEIVSLYQNAKLFVTPSTIEGFGQTPIEAAIYKCPVISTKETALPESTLGLLNYYEPATSPDALAVKILEVLQCPESKKTLEQISDRFKSEYDIKKQSVKIWKVLGDVFKELNL